MLQTDNFVVPVQAETQGQVTEILVLAFAGTTSIKRQGQMPAIGLQPQQIPLSPHGPSRIAAVSRQTRQGSSESVPL